MAKIIGSAGVFIIFSAMNRTKQWMWPAVLIALVVLIKVFSANENLVENYYSTGVYTYISAFLKYVFGWVPFSVGDVLYAVLIAWMLYKIFRTFARLFKPGAKVPGSIKVKLYNTLITLLVIYVLFNLLWGINYNRKGIVYQLGLQPGKYSTAELITVDSLLLQKVNAAKTGLVNNGDDTINSNIAFKAAENAYSKAALQYPFLQYKPSSLKKSLWGWAGNYIGFTGYYNPFSGEAQVNTTVPYFLQPFTSCHEIAHQLGYAKENEANFVGYLAATASGDTLLLYSVYLDLFLYTQRNLFNADSAKTKYFSNQLLPSVKADLLAWRKFNEAHQSPLEPVFRWVYGKYLENNQQPSGILSYDEVTGFLIAYHKKFGRL